MIGESFGNYRALSLLGEGGMGAVYLAEHPEIGRRVAIKVLRADAAQHRDAQLFARFVNEARAANAIRHPNIIEILDSGTTAAGQPYLVMELLEGESLAARIKRLGRLPAGEAVELACQTASAVGAAHGKGIVHRDLKPDNLFIIPDQTSPGRERVKVLDFGIAKLQVPAAVDAVRTRTGTLMGTPAYMSPEQCLGTKEVDHRSDIYSLGVILFESVCGQLPFVSTGFGELVHMHLNVSPPAPRSLVPGLPAALEQVMLRALAKRPEDRFQSMAELQAALTGGVSRGGRGLPSAEIPATIAVTPLPQAGGHQTTTFSTSAGEKKERTAIPAPAGVNRRRVGAVLAVVAVAAAGAVLVARRDAGGPGPAPAVQAPVPPAVPPPAAVPALVEIGVDSTPPGARVVRASDGALLGTTPWRHRAPAGDPPVEVRVEAAGFEPVTRTLPLERDRIEVLTLSPLPRPRPQAGGRRKPAAPSPADEEPPKL